MVSIDRVQEDAERDFCVDSGYRGYPGPDFAMGTVGGDDGFRFISVI